MNKPTCQEIWDEELGDPISINHDASWRHGAYITDVYKRESDNTYWEVHYRRSTDGETNELEEGIAHISEVEPYEVKTIKYRKKV